MHPPPELRSRPAASLLAAGLLLAVPAAAAPAPAGEQFAEEISVVVVEIPVQVLLKGEPVTGLTREDFELYEGGERREITGFEVLDLSPGTREEPATAPPRAPEAAPPPARRHFLILFDFNFSQRQYLVRALRGVRSMVETQLHPSDRVAVGLYSGGGGTRLITGFTDDRREVELALDVVDAILDADRKEERVRRAALYRLRTGEGGSRSEELARLSSEVGPAAALVLGGAPGLFGLNESGRPGGGLLEAGGGGTAGAGRPGADELVQEGGGVTSLTPEQPGAVGARLAGGSALSELRSLAYSLSELATLLRDLRGQKHLLYLSQGFDGGLLQDSLALDYLEMVFRAFRASGWTLHSVNVAGIEGGFASDALFYLANETGGLLFENYNDIGEATERIIERTSVTYLLAFQRQGLKADGRYRQVEVKLAGGPPGARVVHRPGFYAPKPLDERSGIERRMDAAELLLGDEERRGLPADVLTAALPRAGGPARVPVLVELPGEPLAGGRRLGRLRVEIHGYALNAEGGIEDLFAQELALDLRAVGDTLRQGGLRFLGELDLPAGEHTLRLLARNVASGDTFLTSRPLAVAPLGEAPRLLPPLFIDTSGRWILTRQSGIDHPFTLGERSFLPAAHPTLEAGQAAPLCLMVFHLPAEGAVLESRVYTAEGRMVRGGRLEIAQRLAGDDGAADSLLGRFAPDGLAAGDYLLEVTLAHNATGTRTAAATPFRVVEGGGR